MTEQEVLAIELIVVNIISLNHFKEGEIHLRGPVSHLALALDSVDPYMKV